MVVPLGAFLALDLNQQRNQAYERARADALAQAHHVALAYRQIFERGQHLAAAIASLPAVRREDWPEVNEILGSLRRQFTEFPNLRVSGLDGRMLASAMPGAPASSNAGRDWFVAVLETRDYAISTPFVGVTTGRLVTVLGYPIGRRGEAPAGVVSVTMEISELAELSAHAVAEGFVVTVIDQHGNVLSRVPEGRLGATVGAAADAAFVRAVRQGPPTGVLETAALDGVASVVAFELLPVSTAGPPVAVIASKPRQVVLAPVVQRTTVVAVASILLVVAVSVTGVLGADRLITAPVQALNAVQRRIAQGDLGARPPAALLQDASEFGQLGRTLATLGERLQVKEDEQLAAEARLRAILDAYPGIAVLVSSELVVEEFNATPLVRMGLAREDVVGRHIADLRWDRPQTGEHALRLVRRALAGDVVHEEFVGRFRESGRRILDIRLSPIRNAAGAVTHVAVFGEDVTDARSLEEAARENAARMTLVFNTSSDLLMLHRADEHFTIEAVNTATLDMGRRRPRAAIDPVGMRRDDYLATLGLHPDVIARGRERLQEAVATKRRQSYSVEIAVPDAQGVAQRFSTEVTLSPHCNDGQECTHVLWTARNVTARWQAERALRISEERLLEAQRLAHIGSWEVDVVTDERHWSDEVFRILELVPGDQPPTRALFLGLVHPDDRAAVIGAYDDAIRERRPYAVTHRLLFPDGRVKVVEQQAEFVYDDAGTPLLARGTTQDITERVQVAEALRQSEQRLLQAQRIAQIGDWSLHVASGHLTWSQEVYRIFEVAPESFTPTYEAFLMAVHPRDRERVDQAFRQSLAAREPYRILHRLQMPSGRVKIVEEQGETTYAPDGTPESSRGTVQDVTERMLVAEALRASEASLRQAELLAGFGHYQCDEHGDHLQCSDGLKRLFGLDHTDVRTRSQLDERIHPDDREQWQWAFEREHDASQPFDCTCRVVAPGAPVRTLRARGEFRADPVAGRSRFFAAMIDVSEITEAERRLAELNETLERRVAQRTRDLESSNRELESFSYSVSHDLRAPLRAIEGFTHAVLESEAPRLSPDGLALLRRVQAAAQRMGTLIDALLRLSQMSREPLVAVPVDVTALTRSIADDLVQAVASRPPAVVIADGLTAVGDPRQLRVAFTNLLDNAFKFSARTASAVVEVGQRSVDGRDVFFVRDNGIGFDMADAGKLFQPFERLRPRGEYAGTGIGLATAQRVAQRHGGSAWAESRPGQGATFFLALGAVGAGRA
ncbi:MAG: PAS domain-containing protein [Vicinamibacterales bacterium]